MTKEEGTVTKDHTIINNVDPNGSVERVGNKGNMILGVGGNVDWHG
jgi:hypothetical protein